MDKSILDNVALVSAVVAVVSAQIIKPFIARLGGQKITRDMFISTGGMPSSHTAGVVSLTTAVGFTAGVSTYIFAISFVFSLIVIHDAMGVRIEAGKHAEVINQWSEILSTIHKEKFNKTNLKTLLGHTFSQTFAGAVHGFIIAIIFLFIYGVI